MKFRKKPVEIEARAFVAGQFKSVTEWCGGSIVRGAGGAVVWVEIPTLEGTMRGEVGDWIIRGVQGEFYPCKPHIFAETYEPATPPAAGTDRESAEGGS